MKTLTFVLLFCYTCVSLYAQTSFEQHGIDPGHTAVSGIAAVDYDADGDIDVIALHRVISEVLIWENDGSIPPNWTRILLTDQIIEPMYIFSGDLNSDSLPDLAISSASSNALYCFVNIDGQNNWEEYIMDDAFHGAHGVCIEDINADEHPDVIATAAADNTIAWWENNGGDPDTWPKAVISDEMDGTQSVTAADIDGDGLMDIVGASSDLHKVVVYYNNGDTPLTFDEQLACQTLLLPHWVSVADIDDDGHRDILVAACSSGRIAWLQNDGDTVIHWTQRTIGSNFGCALSVEAADFDMDGDLDVAATAYGSNNFAWWEHDINNNQIIWNLHMLSGSYMGAWPLVIADVEGDTDQDILTGGDLLNGQGNESPLSFWENSMLTTSVDKTRPESGNTFKLWPQPASDHLSISYDLDAKAFVSIALYNMRGVEMFTLVKAYESEGKHELDLDLSTFGAGLKPGTYVFRFIAGDRVHSRKLILMGEGH